MPDNVSKTSYKSSKYAYFKTSSLLKRNCYHVPINSNIKSRVNKLKKKNSLRQKRIVN